MLNIEQLINDLEFQLEILSLKELGFSEEEIEGYFEFYWESWVIPVGVTHDKN
jgi:hypothetical protein